MNAWLPPSFDVPARLVLPAGAVVRPLQSSDVDLVGPALRAHRAWFARVVDDAGASALATASASDDLEVLEQVEAAARRRSASVHIVVDPSGGEMLGGVSFRPGEHDERVATVEWWVVPVLQASRIEEELDAYVRRWASSCWPFTGVETPFNPCDDPAAIAGANLAVDLDAALRGSPIVPADVDSAAALWRSYRASADRSELPDSAPTAESFGDSAEMADELLALVRRGVKTATASLRSQYPDRAVPETGAHWIAADGHGRAAVVLRTVSVRVGPLDSVDDDFAWAEGEGDRSRDGWLRGHRRYWERTDPGDALDEVVFERFRVVWPPEAVERAAAFSASFAATRRSR